MRKTPTFFHSTDVTAVTNVWSKLRDELSAQGEKSAALITYKVYEGINPRVIVILSPRVDLENLIRERLVQGGIPFEEKDDEPQEPGKKLKREHRLLARFFPKEAHWDRYFRVSGSAAALARLREACSELYIAALASSEANRDRAAALYFSAAFTAEVIKALAAETEHVYKTFQEELPPEAALL